jgi:thiamine biosynthesis lipoprotein
MGDLSVSTSGSQDRSFTWDHQNYHHILDPRTGYPAQGSAMVTVMHTEATTADAGATALFVAGPTQWQRIAKRMGIRYVLLVDETGVVHMTPAMHERVQLLEKGRKVLISEPT